MATSAGRATVLLVEDDARTRDHLARAVAADERLALAGACGSVAEAKAALARSAPDVLLTDLGLPDGSGIDLIRLVRAESARTLAMVVTVFGDENTVVRAIQAGAAGYLLKDDTPRSIADSIVELIEGGSPISAPIARLLLRRVASAPAGGSEAAKPADAARAGSAAAATAPASGGAERPVLTAREHEVLSLVAKGFTFPEVARLLEVSRHTVTAHVRHIYEKLEVSTRGEAVFEAVQQGLIRISE
jgi:DNA-binding NarL/FixJ family response regulator